MIIQFNNLPEELQDGVERLKKVLNFETGEEGIPVNVRQGDEICVSLEGGAGSITYAAKNQFFRALGLFIENALSKKAFEVKETARYDSFGVMIDASRNGVMSVEAIMECINYLAVMGYSFLMMYTEDTYEVPELPYFGYMRGRYTYDEIRRLDDYAYGFGIEMFPCMQTLGHLEHMLKWMGDLRDTARVIMPEDEKTYEVLDKMITAATKPYRSNRIHVGMDEPWQLGRGRYYELKGIKNPLDIYTDHIRFVADLCEKKGLEPMMWGGMFFRLFAGSDFAEGYDGPILEEHKKRIPHNMQVVTGSYGKNEEAMIDRIEKFKQLGCRFMFTGGMESWYGFTTHNYYAIENAEAAHSACEKLGIRDFLTTGWSNDGTEASWHTMLLGLSANAELAYNIKADRETLRRRFEFCTGQSYDACLLMSHFHDPAEFGAPKYEFHGKGLLWQDIMIGMRDKFLFDNPMSEAYEKVGKALREYWEKGGKWKNFYEYAALLFETASLKCFIAERLKKAYDAKDTEFLEKCAKEYLPELINRVRRLCLVHEREWLANYKPFGWEVINVRYSGVIGRAEYAIRRLEDYLGRKTEILPELEEARLSHEPHTRKVSYLGQYSACGLEFHLQP